MPPWPFSPPKNKVIKTNKDESSGSEKETRKHTDQNSKRKRRYTTGTDAVEVEFIQAKKSGQITMTPQPAKLSTPRPAIPRAVKSAIPPVPPLPSQRHEEAAMPRRISSSKDSGVDPARIIGDIARQIMRHLSEGFSRAQTYSTESYTDFSISSSFNTYGSGQVKMSGQNDAVSTAEGQMLNIPQRDERDMAVRTDRRVTSNSRRKEEAAKEEQVRQDQCSIDQREMAERAKRRAGKETKVKEQARLEEMARQEESARQLKIQKEARDKELARQKQKDDEKAEKARQGRLEKEAKEKNRQEEKDRKAKRDVDKAAKANEARKAEEAETARVKEREALKAKEARMAKAAEAARAKEREARKVKEAEDALQHEAAKKLRKAKEAKDAAARKMRTEMEERTAKRVAAELEERKKTERKRQMELEMPTQLKQDLLELKDSGGFYEQQARTVIGRKFGDPNRTFVEGMVPDAEGREAERRIARNERRAEEENRRKEEIWRKKFGTK